MTDTEGGAGGPEGDAGPVASRPHMPGYGLAPADEGELLPWSWAVERLAEARNYWVSTVDPGGAPHLAAVWGVWIDGGLVFSTGGRSRKARNLAAVPRCVVTPERADEAVVVEGVATRVTDAAAVERVADAYRAKYGSGFPDPADNPLLAVRPTRAFGVVEEEPGFTTRTTRWTWSPAG